METALWVDRMRELGFTQNEAKIYVALLGEPALTAAKLVRKAGVPRPKIYEAARSLIEQGFAEEVVGEVKAFRAVDPTVAFRGYKLRSEQKLSRSEEMLTALAHVVPNTGPLPADGWDVRMLQGVVNVRTEVMALEDSAKEIIRFMGPPFYPLSTPKRMVLRYSDEIQFYGLLERASFDDPNKGADVRAMGLEDSRFHVVEKLPFRGVIFDRKVLVLPLRETTEGPTLFIPESNLIHTMAEWAIETWQNSPSVTTELQPRTRATPKENDS
jgi:HTH-type transcriptional regulator, sugar sensing transcriptional regulator